MKTLNHPLANGNITLDNVTSKDQDIAFQLWWKDVTVNTASVEVWVSTNPNKDYAKLPDLTRVITGADKTMVIALSGLSYLYIKFVLVVVGSGVAGTITEVNSINDNKYADID